MTQSLCSSERSCTGILKSYTTDKIPQTVKDGAGRVYQKCISNPTSMLVNFTSQHVIPNLYPRALATHTTNWLRAKINPFSNPPGWTEEKEEAQKKIERLKKMKAHAEGKLNHSLPKPLIVGGNFRVKHPTQSKSKKIHNQDIERRRDVAHILKKGLDNAEQLDDHLEKTRISIIAGRLAGYAGTIVHMGVTAVCPAAAFVPGTSIIADLFPKPTAFVADKLLTAAVVRSQVNNAARLPDDATFTAAQRAKARKRKILTIVCGAMTFLLCYQFKNEINDAKIFVLQKAWQSGDLLINGIHDLLSSSLAHAKMQKAFAKNRG